MAKYKFIRGATNNIASTNRVDGQILFDTTLSQLYFDVKRANSNVVDRFLLDTEVDSISDELILSMFDDDDILVYGSVEDFPASGQDGKIYYASAERKFYTWDGTDYEEYDIDDSSLVYKIDDASGDSIDDADYIPYFDLSANTKKRILFSTIKTAMAAIYENKTAVEDGTALSLVTTGDKYRWDHKGDGAGTVTQISTGAGLTGGPVTTTGTIKVKLKSETASTLAAESMGSTASRQYAVGVDKDGYLSVNVPWTDENTWTANSSSAAGYVASGSGQNKKAWMTDASGTPAWRDYDEMSAITDSYIMGLFDDDDVLAYASTSSFPATGNTSKLYYAIDTGKFYKWNGSSYEEYDVATGTVRSVTAGVGLAGGTITETGTIKAKLKSETASALDAIAMGNTADRQYAVGVDKDGYLSVNVPWTDNNTTYTPQSLGIGYGTCSTGASTAAKTVSLTDYNLVTNGIVSVKFTNAVPASATLNVNSKGAKAIYYKGAAITAGVITAGAIATFIFDGTYYHLIAIDKASPKYVKGTLAANATSITISDTAITSTALINIYTSIAGVMYTAISQSSGSVTLTYPAQSASMNIILEIKEVSI